MHLSALLLCLFLPTRFNSEQMQSTVKSGKRNIRAARPMRALTELSQEVPFVLQESTVVAASRDALRTSEIQVDRSYMSSAHSQRRLGPLARKRIVRHIRKHAGRRAFPENLRCKRGNHETCQFHRIESGSCESSRIVRTKLSDKFILLIN